MQYNDSYLRSNETFEAWLFHNHIFLMMMDAIDGYISHWSFEDLRSMLVKVRTSKFANDWHSWKKTKKVVSLCADLDLDISEI